MIQKEPSTRGHIYTSFLKVLVTLCCVGLCLEGIPLLMAKENHPDDKAENEYMSSINSKSIYTASLISSAMTVPLILDPILEFCENGSLTMIKSCKLVLILSMGLPNLVIVCVSDMSGGMQLPVYILASNTQRIVMVATILAQLQYIDSGMYTVWNVLCLMLGIIVSDTLEILGFAFDSPIWAVISLVIEALVLVYYLYLSVVWIYSTNINILLVRDENTSFIYNAIMDLLEYIFAPDAEVSVSTRKSQRQAPLHNSRNLSYDDILCCFLYIIVLALYQLAWSLSSGIYGYTSETALQERSYSAAFTTMLILIVHDRKVFLQLQKREDEFQNKRIFVQYVANETSTSIGSALNEINTMISDLQREQHMLQEKFSELRRGNVTPPRDDSLLTPDYIHTLDHRIDKLQDVGVNCQSSVGYLNDLIKFDKLEANVLVGDKEEVAAWKFVRMQVEYFSTQAALKRVRIVNSLWSGEYNENGTAKILPIRMYTTNGAEDSYSIRGMTPGYVDPPSRGPAGGLLGLLSGNTPGNSLYDNESSKHSYIGPANNIKRALLYVNKNKIVQVVRHLISNAIKYSPIGGVVHVTTQLLANTPQPLPGAGLRDNSITQMFRKSKDRVLTASEQDDDTFGGGHAEQFFEEIPVVEELICRIEITDQGPGIDKAEQSKIFSKRNHQTYSAGKISLWLCKVIVEMHGGSMGCISPAVFETEPCIKGRGSDGSGSNSPRAIIQSTINMGAPESCVEMNVGANGGDASAAARSNYADVEEGKGGTTFFVELPVNEMYNNEKNSIISNHLVKIMPIYGGNGAFGASGDVDSRSPKRKPTTSERQEQSRENVDNRDRMTESEMMTPVVNRYDFMSNIRDESGASGASGASSRVSAESANADFAHVAAIVRPKGPGLEEPMVADNPGCVGVGIGHSDTSPMAVRNTDSTPPPNATNMNFTPSSKPIAIGNYRPVDHTTTSDPIPIPW